MKDAYTRPATEPMLASHRRRVQAHADKVRLGQPGPSTPGRNVHRGGCQLQMEDGGQTNQRRYSERVQERRYCSKE